MRVEVFGPEAVIPPGIIFPQQTHSCNIQEIVTGMEDLTDCDGIWCSRDSKLQLGIKTADCAPIAFWDDHKYGIIHAGWRGLVGGIIENMLEIFDTPEAQIFVGPILPQFEIQRDFCYDALYEKFGDLFFTLTDSQAPILFDFKLALKSILPNAKFDPRITSKEPTLASWRRDQDTRRNMMVMQFRDD